MLRVNYFQLIIRYSIIPDCQPILWYYEEERSGCGWGESYFVMAARKYVHEPRYKDPFNQDWANTM